MIDLAFYASLAVLLWFLLQYGFMAVEVAFNNVKKNADKRIRKFDGPFVLALFMLNSCAHPDKTIVLYDMPGTIEITRGEDAANSLCKSIDKPLWGCAIRVPESDLCRIALNWERGRGTDLHEFAHCAGENEQGAQALVRPE